MSIGTAVCCTLLVSAHHITTPHAMPQCCTVGALKRHTMRVPAMHGSEGARGRERHIRVLSPATGAGHHEARCPPRVPRQARAGKALVSHRGRMVAGACEQAAQSLLPRHGGAPRGMVLCTLPHRDRGVPVERRSGMRPPPGQRRGEAPRGAVSDEARAASRIRGEARSCRVRSRGCCAFEVE